MDQKTSIFNRLCVRISKADYIRLFEGKVALSINGLVIHGGHQVYLDVTVYQIKIEAEDETTLSASDDCIFST
jgi:hypothetical protein